ncbi:MAG TPA: hypothetical protein VJZ75_03060, partial [Candidatus Bathyarchaeia archaeon]|nr:hypothetical protein [Candidatus Bathyarchaeia archaeon]
YVLCMETALFGYGETVIPGIWVLPEWFIDRFCEAKVGVTAEVMKRPTSSKPATIANFLKLFMFIVHLQIDFWTYYYNM